MSTKTRPTTRAIRQSIFGEKRSNGGSAVDGRTTRAAGYIISQRIRKRVEEIFGWGKTVGNFRKTRLVGSAKNKLAGFMVGAAYNLVRLAKLLPLPEPA